MGIADEQQQEAHRRCQASKAVSLVGMDYSGQQDRQARWRFQASAIVQKELSPTLVAVEMLGSQASREHKHRLVPQPGDNAQLTVSCWRSSGQLSGTCFLAES